MSNRRLVQHRQQRDTNVQEKTDLKKENGRLKRQVARLRKQIEKLQQDAAGISEDMAAQETFLTCPKCESTDLGEVFTPTNKKILSCKSCRRWRSKPV